MENWFPWEHWFYAIVNSSILLGVLVILGWLIRDARRRPPS